MLDAFDNLLGLKLCWRNRPSRNGHVAQYCEGNFNNIAIMQYLWYILKFISTHQTFSQHRIAQIKLFLPKQ